MSEQQLENEVMNEMRLLNLILVRCYQNLSGILQAIRPLERRNDLSMGPMIYLPISFSH